MKTPGSQQIEFDVFPKNAKDDYSYLSNIKRDTSSGGPSFTVTLPQQSVIILTICVVMFLVVSFALGVERGKLIAKNTVKAPAAPWENPAMPAAEAPTHVSLKKPPQEIMEAAAKAPEEKAPAAQVTTPSAGNYVIQVASLKTEQAAARLTQTLSKDGWPSFTKTSGEYVVVLAGSFLRKEEAQSRIGELKKTYTDCFIKQI